MIGAGPCLLCQSYSYIRAHLLVDNGFGGAAQKHGPHTRNINPWDFLWAASICARTVYKDTESGAILTDYRIRFESTPETSNLKSSDMGLMGLDFQKRGRAQAVVGPL